MDSRLFWRAALVQTACIAVLFGLLALAFDKEFFEDWGLLTGPVAWVACSLVTGRVLRLPLAYVLFCALAGGVAAGVATLLSTHLAGLIAGVAVFAASCAGHDAARDEEPAPPQ